MTRFWYSTRDICDATGLQPAQVRAILSAMQATGKYRGDIRKGQTWGCRAPVFEELFGGIVEQRQLEQQAEAERKVIEAEAVIERRRVEAEIRREQAEARREATRNAARSRLQLVTKRRCRRPAAYRLAVVPR